MSNWWDDAPLANSGGKTSKDWWSEAPVYSATAPAPAPVDPIKAQVRAEIDAEKAAGIPQDGIGRRFLQGATLNTADEIMAAAMTPVQMWKRGVGPSEGYAYAKAKEDARLEDARADGGITGALGEAAGGMLTGGALAKAGVTAIPALTARLGGVAGTAAGGAVDGAMLGAVTGFADGEEGHRLERAAQDAVVGGAVGGALPLALAAAKPVVAPIASNVMARVNPEGYAERQIARAAARSGQTPEQIAERVGQAAADGQGEFRLLDGLGYDGARAAAVVAKNPGEGRTQIREFLNDRQTGQARRIGEAVTEAFDAPQTARGQISDLYAWARDASEPFYARAMAETPVWSERLNDFLKDPITKQSIRRGLEIQRLESLAKGEKFDPFDIIERFDAAGEPVLVKVPNMRTVNVVKKGFDHILEEYRDTTTGKLVLDEKGRAIDQVRRAFLGEVDGLNPEFAKARAMYAGPMEIKDAIGLGRQAGAGRARAADNIAQFEGMNDVAKQGFRAGYVDPILGRVEKAAEGVNKTRQFSSDAAKAELEAFARPGEAERLTNRLGRENEMFANRAEALGNSKTAENLADNADTGIDPGVFEKLITGRFVGATKDLLMRGAASLNGNTEAVRAQMAKLLMEGDQGKILTLLLRLGQQSGRQSEVGAGAFRGLLSGGLPALNSTIAERQRRPTPQAAGTGR